MCLDCRSFFDPCVLSFNNINGTECHYLVSMMTHYIDNCLIIFAPVVDILTLAALLRHSKKVSKKEVQLVKVGTNL